MEDLLKKLVEHAESKPTYSVIVSGDKSRLSTTFNPPLRLPTSRHYEMALSSLETYYSFPNIDVRNNTVKVSKDKGQTWMDIKIPTGFYDIDAINNELQRLITLSTSFYQPIATP